jgi:hypothetical protein
MHPGPGFGRQGGSQRLDEGNDGIAAEPTDTAQLAGFEAVGGAAGGNEVGCVVGDDSNVGLSPSERRLHLKKRLQPRAVAGRG